MDDQLRVNKNEKKWICGFVFINNCYVDFDVYSWQPTLCFNSARISVYKV